MNERINDRATSKEYFNPDYTIRLLNTMQVFINKYKTENNIKFRYTRNFVVLKYFRVFFLLSNETYASVHFVMF